MNTRTTATVAVALAAIAASCAPTASIDADLLGAAGALPASRVHPLIGDGLTSVGTVGIPPRSDEHPQNPRSIRRSTTHITIIEADGS